MLLALDTSADYVSIALLDKTKVVGYIHEQMSHGQGESLIPLIQKLLKQKKKTIKDIDHIAVAVGPGSFTGVRIALACARAFALALDIPVWGITNFAAAVYDLRKKLKVVLDTKRGDFFVQDFNSRGKPVGNPSIKSAQQLKKSLPFVATGSGANILAQEIKCDVVEQPLPSAVAVGLAATTHPELIQDASPLYLRDADVTV